MRSGQENARPLEIAPIVAQIADKIQAKEMLFYNGPREFFEDFHPSHSMEIEAYTDSIIGAARALPCELVVCVNYLHQVGMLRIHDVLDELKRVTQGVGFFHIETDHEIEDANSIDQPVEWWIAEFVRRFALQTFQRVPGGFYVIVYPRMH